MDSKELLTRILAVILCLCAVETFAEKSYGPGVSDTEIKVGQSYPYSLPTIGLFDDREDPSHPDQPCAAEIAADPPPWQCRASGAGMQPSAARRAHRRSASYR